MNDSARLSRDGLSEGLFRLGRCSESPLSTEACTAGAQTISEWESNIT